MGFFHVLEEKSSKSAAISSQSLAKLGCQACPLDKAKLSSPKMLPSGADNPLIYFIGDVPSWSDDRVGEHYSDQYGQLIKSRIPSKYKRQIRWNNVIRCHTDKIKDVSVECCRRLQVEDISKHKPKVVVGFGTEALRWFTNRSQLNKVWRGRRIPLTVGGHSFWFYPMLAADFVVRMGGESYRGKEWGLEFSADLAQVFRDLDEGLPEPVIYTEEDARKDLVCWKPGDDLDEWCDAIQTVCAGGIVGYDKETTGLNAYKEGAKILTASLDDGENTIAFPIGHPEARFSPSQQNKILEALVKGLLSAKRVLAHNAPFEQEWGILHFPDGMKVVHQIKWGCSQAQAYVLDERKGGHSLDDLCLIHFGMLNMKGMFKLDIGNLINEPLAEVLPYNAVDSRMGRKLWMAQKKLLLKQGLTRVSEEHERRQACFARMQVRGLTPDREKAAELDGEYTKKIDDLTAEIERQPEVIAFNKKGKRFNPNTPEDVRDALIAAGHDIEDAQEGTLATIRGEFPALILERRSAVTLHSRYISPIHTGQLIQPDGLIHPRFSGTRTATSRVASEDPNAQNFPKRKQRHIRRMIRAPKGYWFVACDYGQIEARIFPMATKDKRLIDEMWTGYDIHAYWLDRIVKAYPKWKKGPAAKIHDPKVRKAARDAIKNEWTFPSFFGAQLSSRAGYLEIPEKYLEEIDKEFWVRYSGVKTWQQQILDFAARNRYVETLGGFRRHWGEDTPLTPNQSINTPIQGTAAEIVISSMEDLDNLAFEREEPWFGPHLNVHDDLSFMIPKGPHDEEALELIGKTMCMRPYSFINVPLTVEMSVGENWCDLQEIHVFNSKDYGMKRQ